MPKNIKKDHLLTISPIWDYVCSFFLVTMSDIISKDLFTNVYALVTGILLYLFLAKSL